MKREKKVNSKSKTVKQAHKSLNKKSNYSKKKSISTKIDKVDSKLKSTTKRVVGSQEVNKKKAKTQKQKNSFQLSADQLTQLGDNFAFFQNKTAEELKTILKKNNQVCSGNKTDLVERCAQGKLLGALPNCSKCSGGKLRFNIKTGEYKCPGYMDDTDFKFCNFKTFEGIERQPWVD